MAAEPFTLAALWHLTHDEQMELNALLQIRRRGEDRIQELLGPFYFRQFFSGDGPGQGIA